MLPFRIDVVFMCSGEIYNLFLSSSNRLTKYQLRNFKLTLPTGAIIWLLVIYGYITYIYINIHVCYPFVSASMTYFYYWVRSCGCCIQSTMKINHTDTKLPDIYWSCAEQREKRTQRSLRKTDTWVKYDGFFYTENRVGKYWQKTTIYKA